MQDPRDPQSPVSDDDLFGPSGTSSLTAKPEIPTNQSPVSDDDLFGGSVAHTTANKLIGSMGEPTQLPSFGGVAQFTADETKAVPEARPAPLEPLPEGPQRDILPGESRRQYLERKRGEYQGSAEQIRAQELATRSTISPISGDWKDRIQGKLLNMRLFTNRSLVEFDQSDDSGFGVGAPAAHPIETAKSLVLGIPHFFYNLVAQPVSLVMDKTTPGGFLLPEEKEQYTRETVANVAGLLVGGAMGRISAEMRVGREFLRAGARETMTDAELNILRTTLPRAVQVENTVLGKVVTGIHEGAAGGAVMGFLSGTDNKERRDLAASYALMAIPAGLAFEAIKGANKTSLGPIADAAAQAQDLSLIRQNQYTEGVNIRRANESFYNMATSKDLATAAIRTARNLNEGAVIPALTTDRIRTMALAEAEHGDFITHKRSDGLYDIMVNPPTDLQSKAFFEVSGFLPEQPVHFLGNEYTYERPVLSSKGNLEGHIIKDAHGAEVEVGLDHLRRGFDMMANPFEITKEDVKRGLYEDFRKFIRLRTPEGADGPVNRTFRQLVEEYASTKHEQPENLPGLFKFLGDRYGEELRNQSLSPNERIAYEGMVAEARSYPKELAGELSQLATTNGMYVERANGSIFVRDAQTGTQLGHFLTSEEAKNFVNTADQAMGTDLIGDNGVPPGVAKGLIAPQPDPNGPHTSTFNYQKDGPLAQFRHWFNTTLPGRLVTKPREVMIALDSQLGTQFNSQVWHPLQEAFRRKYAFMHEDMRRIAGISRLAKGLKPDQYDAITSALETRSAEEMVKAGTGLFKRGFTDKEIAGARWFADHQIDVKKAFAYYRGLKNLERRMGDTGPRVDEAVKRLQVNLNMDENHLEAARVLGRVLAINKPGELSIYGIVRLADAIAGGTLEPEAYMQREKFTPQQRKVYDELKSYYKQIAPKFNIPEEQQLQGYMPHLRIYKDDVIFVGRDNAPVFTSELLRTGEMDEFDRDPINVAVRYTNSGYNNLYTKQALEKAYDYVNEATARLPEREMIRKIIVNDYIDQLRGVPHDTSKWAQKTLNGMLKRLEVKSSVDTRRDLVNTFLSLTSSATIGFRPMQGIRDFHNLISLYYSRFGERRTAAMLTQMARVTPDDLKAAKIIKEVVPGESTGAALTREGQIPTMGAINIVTPQERLANSISGRTQPVREFIQKTGEAGIKWGLQHTIYKWAHSAVYLETYTRALKEIGKMEGGSYGAGDAAKVKAYDKLFMNSYDPPVQQFFDQLVREGRFREAADFLGKATSYETVSVSGLANHPLGWGTNTGRILGQFGSWPVWARSQLMRLASRGTARERAGVMT